MFHNMYNNYIPLLHDGNIKNFKYYIFSKSIIYRLFDEVIFKLFKVIKFNTLCGNVGLLQIIVQQCSLNSIPLYYR